MTERDWPGFLSSYDLTFDTLPQSWHDAPHFGNAMIGSMLYMKEGRLCLEVFRADVCDHRGDENGWTAYSRPHYRIGCFLLDCDAKVTGCSWRKRLWDAELTGRIETDKGEIRIRHYTHAEEMAIVTDLAPAADDLALSWAWFPVEAETTRPGYPTDETSLETFARRYGEHYKRTLKEQVPNAPGYLKRVEGTEVWVQDLAAGGQYATAWHTSRFGPTMKHRVTIANRYPETDAADLAVADLARFRETDADTWISAHRAWWHNYYPRSFVSLPDKSLEALYWQSIYRYGCCSRAGRYYVDTSGLWFQGAQWPYSTHDWNTQSAHWGVYAANRLDQGREIVDRLKRFQLNLIEAVSPEAWREDSAYLNLATAGDLRGGRIGDMRYHDLLGCLPWLLHNAWWQYRFSMDESILRETIFPLLRRAVHLYLHWTEEDEDGALHLKPTYSPEMNVVPDCNFDLALFKWGCHVLLYAASRLGIKDPLIPQWERVVDQLVAFPEDENGFMLGSGQSAPVGHRHLSHLLMIYPLYLVNVEQEGVDECLSRSYVRAHGDPDVVTGEAKTVAAMVQTHAIPIGAAIGDSARALEGLKRLQSELHPNGLWECGGNPCIESTLGLVAGIQEMLLQSWCDPATLGVGTIRVFPAVPSAWPDVRFENLRAEGAFLVSAERRDGLTRWVRMESLAGEPCRVRPEIEGEFDVDGLMEDAVTEIAAGIYEIDLKEGECVVLRRKGYKSE